MTLVLEELAPNHDSEDWGRRVAHAEGQVARSVSGTVMLSATVRLGPACTVHAHTLAIQSATPANARRAMFEAGGQRLSGSQCVSLFS